MFFFFALEDALEEALDRPEEPEEDFCTFAMGRMLAEGSSNVNDGGISAAKRWKSAVSDSLNRPGASVKINFVVKGGSPRH